MPAASARDAPAELVFRKSDYLPETISTNFTVEQPKLAQHPPAQAQRGSPRLGVRSSRANARAGVAYRLQGDLVTSKGEIKWR